MALQYSTTVRNDELNQVVSVAGSTAYILVYSGSAPANCAASATGTLLLSLPCSSTIGTVSGGVLTFSAITSEAPGANGTAGYWRLCTDNTGATCVAQGTAGTSGADINWAGGVAWTTGMTIGISSLTITAGGA